MLGKPVKHMFKSLAAQSQQINMCLNVLAKLLNHFSRKICIEEPFQSNNHVQGHMSDNPQYSFYICCNFFFQVLQFSTAMQFFFLAHLDRPSVFLIFGTCVTIRRSLFHLLEASFCSISLHIFYPSPPFLFHNWRRRREKKELFDRAVFLHIYVSTPSMYLQSGYFLVVYKAF